MDSSGAVAAGMPWHTARGLGGYGERMAVRYLTDQGLDVIDQNWRCDLGEIDIVARDGGCLVVCESRPVGTTVRAADRGGRPSQAGRLRRLARPGSRNGAPPVRRSQALPDPRRRRRRAATSPRTLPDRACRRGPVVTLGRARAVGLRGIVGFVVDVEVDIASGLPAFLVGGCPDGACAQSPDRVKAAAANSGHPCHCAGSR